MTHAELHAAALELCRAYDARDAYTAVSIHSDARRSFPRYSVQVWFASRHMDGEDDVCSSFRETAEGALATVRRLLEERRERRLALLRHPFARHAAMLDAEDVDHA